MLKIIKTVFNTFVDWANIYNKPSTFTPSTHNHSGIYEPVNSNIQSHISSTSNPHSVSKSDVGLSNVDNTSDANKPVSTDQATALGLKVDKVTGKGLSTNDYTTAEQTKVGYLSVTGAINLDTMGSYLDQSVKTTASPSFTGLTVDTSVFKVDAVNNRVGVGTANPNYPVHFMFPATKTNTTIFEGYGDNASALGFKAFVGRGSASSPATLQQYDNIMAFQALAHNGGSGSTNFSQGADLIFMTESAPVANATYYRGSINFKVSDGTNASVNRLQINGNGGVYTNGFAAVINNVSTSTVVTYLKGIAGQTGNYLEVKDSTNAVLTKISATGLIFPIQAATASAPAYVKGGLYFDTTLNKLRIGGATGWETITSA